MELIVAPAVKTGDRVAIVAPASPVSTDLLEASTAVLRSWLVSFSLKCFRKIFSVLECKFCKKFVNPALYRMGAKLSV